MSKEGCVMSDTVKKRHESINIPVLPLRGIVIFPETIIHFDVGRDRSIHALDAAMNKDQQLFLITQKDPQTDEPEREDLYNIGTLGTIKQILKLPGDRMRVLVEGKARARLMDLQSTDSCLMGDITVLRTTKARDTIETRALVRSVCDALDNYAKISGRISPDTLAAILSAAMMFEYAFGLMEEGKAIRKAVAESLENNVVTDDLASGGKAFTTAEVGDWVAAHI